jgi:hypothetical protein
MYHIYEAVNYYTNKLETMVYEAHDPDAIPDPIVAVAEIFSLADEFIDGLFALFCAIMIIMCIIFVFILTCVFFVTRNKTKRH